MTERSKAVKSFLILGSGRQGLAIADGLKALDPEYYVAILDSNYERIKEAPKGLNEYIHDSEWPKHLTSRKWSVVVSALPYHLNDCASRLCIDIQLPYLDLGGHCQTTERIKKYAFEKRGIVAVDQGLAPGLLNLMAWKVVRHAQKNSRPLQSVEMYCGAIPSPGLATVNSLGYLINFSPDGLVNEYLNDIQVLQDGKIVAKDKLHLDQEVNDFPGFRLEAFRTSGATPTDFLRSMARAGVRNVDYRTLRYPGHIECVQGAYFQLLVREEEKAQNRLKDFLAHVCEAPKERFTDVAVCRVRATYDDGLQENFDLLIEGDSETRGLGLDLTAMQIGTGYSAAAAASIMATGKVSGVVGYHDLVDAGFFAEATTLGFLS
jgi:saccharopine dehydrogenase-like NADP-dependent oxidoreductase